MLTPSHTDNLVRWNPTISGGHYESHFIKVNLPAEHVAFWWKFTVTQPLEGMGPARFEVWAVFFDIADPARSCASRETFSAAESHIARERLRCVYGENVLEHGHSKGAIAEHGFRWNMTWAAPERSFRHFPLDGMYEGGFPKAKALSPALTTAFEGTAEVAGRVYSLDGQRGMQGHNWGKKHAHSWVWTHCNHFREDERVVFESVSSKIRVGPLSSPQLTIMHVDDGVDEPLTINGWLGMIRTTSDQRGLSWRFRGSLEKRGVEGVFAAPPERFMGLNYVDPDGRITHCLNSKVADGELRILHKDRGIWRLRRSLTAAASAALEIGIKDETRGVRIHVE